MKLFLASTGLSNQLAPHFFGLVGKESGTVQLAHVPNAADPYQEKPWLYETREQIAAYGITVTDLDLRLFADPAGLCKALAAYDVVWIAGGNTFYLRYLMKRSGFDQVIRELVEDGLVYAGGSAGAIVAGPTLHGVELADDPAESPELIWDGLDFVDFVPVPHWEGEDFAETTKQMKKLLDTQGFTTVPIRDSQAIIISDNTYQVI